MKTIFLIAITALSTSLPAQEQINGEVYSTDSATHTVIRIYPDTFPRVNVLFRAQSPGGRPMWDINTKNVIVTENGEECDVLSVNKLSNGQRVNTALVIDHSGSMIEDSPYKHWVDSILHTPGIWKSVTMREYTKGKTDSDSLIKICVMPPCPEYLMPPIWHAKRAAQAYISELDSAKDAVAVIGFADRVQEKMSLSLDFERSNKTVQGMFAVGGTAFYDGVYAGLEETAKGVGIKAVVALTDGQDNASKHSLNEVIAKAKELGIPIYCVGLGVGANRAVLERMSRESGGSAYFTQDPMALTNIYQKINGEIMSIYELVYVSKSIIGVDETHNINLEFEIPGKYDVNSDRIRTVVPELAARIDEQDENFPVNRAMIGEQGEISQTKPVSQTPEEKSKWPLAASIAIGLGGAGIISARYVKKTSEEKTRKGGIEIVNIYPNPTVGPITIVLNTDISGMPGRVIVRDGTGREVYTMPFVFGSAIDLNIGELGMGAYVVSVQAGGNVTAGSIVIVN